MNETLRHVDVANAAVMIAKVLKERFPSAPFEVTIPRPIQSSLHVQWTDGPTKNLVDDALAGFLAQAQTCNNRFKSGQTGRSQWASPSGLSLRLPIITEWTRRE
jgi:hypothetical protein